MTNEMRKIVARWQIKIGDIVTRWQMK